MCFRSATKRDAAAALLGAMLGGCSEYYFDRRDTVTLHSGDAMAANRVTQMIDPWPAASGQRNIAYNGEKAATASERYRTGRIIQPVNATTSSAAYAAAQQQAQSTANSQASSAPGRRQQQQPDQVGQEQTSNANGQVFERGEQDRGGGAHRRSGVRAVGALDVRRQRRDRAADHLRHRRERATNSTPTASPSSSSISMPAGAEEMAALERMMLRIGGLPPVVVVTQSFDAEVARSLLQMRVADFLVKPVQPVELVRTCARVAALGRDRGDQRGADLHLHSRGRRRRRHHAGDPDRAAAAQQRPARPPIDLPGRSRFPARRLRRLSRSRAAAGPEGNRAAPGAARPAASGNHAVASRLRA